MMQIGISMVCTMHSIAGLVLVRIQVEQLVDPRLGSNTKRGKDGEEEII